MRPTRLALLALAFGALSACSAPPSGGPRTSEDNSVFVPDTPTAYGPGDYCSDTYVLIQPTTRANFSLGSEYYRNGDTCAAYPYIKHILDTEPLFTGEDPDDRNYLRMASIYEDFAAQVDSTNRAEKMAYLDSALSMREMGVAALNREGIAFDSYLRNLREGFFYFQNSDYYDDAGERQYQAFNRAFEAQPDSLEDWYLVQLFNASGEQFGEDLPNPDRAEFIRTLAGALDDPALKQNYTLYADYVETDPAESGEVTVGSDEVVEELIAAARGGTIAGNDALRLLAVVLQQPERVEALNEDVGELRTILLRNSAVTDQVDNPRTLYALALQAYGDGESSRGNDLFNRAIANAQSNAQRADFYYSRGVSRYGSANDFTRALEYFPNHGPSLYRRAGQIAQSVGRPSSLRGRFAYWCLADIYRNVAASSSDSRISSTARRAAAQYERAGPSRDQYFLEGFSPGQSVTASLGAYGSCTTRVR
ncbi:tetratricopeptide repeat protein [Rubrivirga sp.]|uniref:tetratricopeptide repeat protein n=1 Tax=Rubrivirga sp. TaxID=1885344 RepID=UPI003B51F0E3